MEARGPSCQAASERQTRQPGQPAMQTAQPGWQPRPAAQPVPLAGLDLPQRSHHGRHLGVCLPCRLAGWQAGRLAGWQAGRLAGWQAGWLSGYQAIRLARRLSDWSTCGWGLPASQTAGEGMGPRPAPRPASGPGRRSFWSAAPPKTKEKCPRRRTLRGRSRLRGRAGWVVLRSRVPDDRCHSDTGSFPLRGRARGGSCALPQEAARNEHLDVHACASPAGLFWKAWAKPAPYGMSS